MGNQRNSARANALAQDKKSNTSLVVGAAAVGVPKTDANVQSAKIANRVSQSASTTKNTYTPTSQPEKKTTTSASANNSIIPVTSSSNYLLSDSLKSVGESAKAAQQNNTYKASTGTNYLGLSSNLQKAGNSMVNTINTKLSTDGAVGNAVVKNLRNNGLPEASASLKSQLDALERERYIAELRAIKAEKGQAVKIGGGVDYRGAANPNYAFNRNAGMTDYQRQLAKTKADEYRRNEQRAADENKLQKLDDEMFVKYLEGINARDRGDMDAYDAAYEAYDALRKETAILKQKIDPSSMENAAMWEWDMAELLASTGEAKRIRGVYEQGKELRESYTTDMIGSEDRYWEEQTYRNELRKLKEKYGTDMVLCHGQTETTVRGFFRAVNSKSWQSMENEVSPLGEMSRGQYAYIGPVGAAAEEGDTVKLGEKTYLFRRVEPYHYGNQTVYLWGLCVEKGVNDTWGTQS